MYKLHQRACKDYLIDLLSSPPNAEEESPPPPPGVANMPGVRPPVNDGKAREGVGTEGVWKWGLEVEGEGEGRSKERGGGGGGLPAEGGLEIGAGITEHV